MEEEMNFKKAKKKRSKKYNSSKRRKEIEQSSEEDADASESLYPIAHYINDREEMINQIFSVMEKEKLNCMLPPILKSMSMKSLMNSCLQELKNMTESEILQVLQGAPPEATCNKISPQLHLKSQSEARFSSSKEVCKAEDERKTLLDILEQEMQEIAFNTVLNQDQNSSTSEEEFPEIVAITETKQKDTVPLICIDSEDEESVVSAEVILQEDSSSDDQFEVIDIEDGVDELQSPSSHSSLMPEDGKFTTVEDVENLAATAGAKWNTEPITNSRGIKVSENFVIQVFSDKETNLERVVKKVLCTPPMSEGSGSKSTNTSRLALNVGADLEEGGRVESSLQQESKTVNNDKQAVTETKEDLKIEDSNILTVNLAPQPASIVQPPLLHDCALTSSDHFKRSSLSDYIQIKEIVSDSQWESKPVEDEEKEEGEITEEESDEVEVIDAEADGLESPIICLSSDESDTHRSNSKTNVRKHHKHRHKKRNSESPEQPNRQIERRGNRSYRRKKSAVTKKGLSVAATNSRLSPNSSLSAPETTPSIPCKNAEKEPKDACDNNKNSSLVCSSSTSITDSSFEAVAPRSVHSNCNDLTEEGKEDANHSNGEDAFGIVGDEPSISKEDFTHEPESIDDSEASSSKSSWADRWAEKRDLKKVVITSKICRNVRKKILSARKKGTSEEKSLTETPLLPPVPPLVLHVEGSVQEYEMLQCFVSDGKDSESVTQLETINLPLERNVQENQTDTMKSVAHEGCELEAISLPPTPKDISYSNAVP